MKKKVNEEIDLFGIWIGIVCISFALGFPILLIYGYGKYLGWF